MHRLVPRLQGLGTNRHHHPGRRYTLPRADLSRPLQGSPPQRRQILFRGPCWKSLPRQIPPSQRRDELLGMEATHEFFRDSWDCDSGRIGSKPSSQPNRWSFQRDLLRRRLERPVQPPAASTPKKPANGKCDSERGRPKPAMPRIGKADQRKFERSTGLSRNDLDKAAGTRRPVHWQPPLPPLAFILLLCNVRHKTLQFGHIPPPATFVFQQRLVFAITMSPGFEFIP